MALFTILLTTLLLASPDTSADSGGTISLAASTKKNILVVRVGGKDVKTYNVSVGTKKYPTPSGTFRINHIVWNPAWVPPPDAKWAKGKEAAKPGDKKNPMKVVKIFFKEPDYYIHGTGDVDNLGVAASHGCIRMDPDEVMKVGMWVMNHGGQPQEESWFWRVLHSRREEKVVYLTEPVPISVID